LIKVKPNRYLISLEFNI